MGGICSHKGSKKPDRDQVFLVYVASLHVVVYCTYVTVSNPTLIVSISHHNSYDVCAKLFPVKSLIGSYHSLGIQASSVSQLCALR